MNSVGIIGAGAAGIMAALAAAEAGADVSLWEKKWGLRARAAVT